MRASIIVFAAVAVMLVPTAAKPEAVRDPGAGFVGQKQPKVGKNYYVVRQGDECTIKTGPFGNAPDGAIDTAPYANKGYAKAALKKLPECKGSRIIDEADGKKRKDDE
jgi:hypothetical protein